MTRFAGSMSTASSAETGEASILSEMNEPICCLNCDRPENVIPLVSLRYAGQQAWICSLCLPTLIHQPAQLAGRLENAHRITPAPPDEH